MKKIKFLCILLLFAMFIPKVYAFTYDLDLSIDTTAVKVGSQKEITVSLKNIQGTSDGIMSCSLNIELDKNLLLSDSVRTLNNWSMTHGKFYLFDTGSPVLNDTKIFVIPLKVNGEGSIKLFDIKCSDGNTNATMDNKSLNFTILANNTTNNSNNNKPDTSGTTDNKNNNSDEKKSSNCDLSNIILSDGTIEFDPAVTEYDVKVKDFETLEVTPVLSNDKASYIVDSNFSQNNQNSIVITVYAEDGNTKVYTLFVEEVSEKVNTRKKNNNYVPIFIGIICVLVLINVVRIVVKKKK